VIRRWIAGLLVFGAVLCAAGVASAQSARYAMVVQGASGGDEFSALHRRWVDQIVAVLRDKFGFDAAHLKVLSEQPTGAEQKSTAEIVRATLTAFAASIKPGDQLFVMLIGHGGGQGADAKFNLIGPDLTVAEWNALLKPVKGRITFVDATSASYSFLQGLAGPDRVIVTATSSFAQQYHTMFAEGFIAALSSTAADIDKNGRISIWEAFTYASRETAQHYEKKGTMSTETAALTDTSDGTPRPASAPNQADSLASLTFLDAPAHATSSDPAIQALMSQRESLETRVDELRRTRRMMSADDFDAAFEKLIVELATVSREIRRKTGGERPPSR